MARVLVVEDDEHVARHVVRALSGRGHVVQIERDGAKAFKRLTRERPDVALLDDEISKIDGAELCRRIKAVSTMPVVMMTSKYIDIDEVGTRHGPDAFVQCPFLAETLINAIEHVLYGAGRE